MTASEGAELDEMPSPDEVVAAIAARRAAVDRRAELNHRLDRAIDLVGEGRHAVALAGLARIVEIDPDYLPVFPVYGRLLARQGRAADAAAVLERGAETARRAGDLGTFDLVRSMRAAIERGRAASAPAPVPR